MLICDNFLFGRTIALVLRSMPKTQQRTSVHRKYGETARMRNGHCDISHPVVRCDVWRLDKKSTDALLEAEKMKASLGGSQSQ